MKFFTTTQLSENIHTTPEGYLVCLGVPIARTGEMIYQRGELPLEGDDLGKVTVVRDAAEVFRPETIASFQGKSFTLWHPDDFVDPKTWTTKTKGIIQNVRRGSGANESDLMADILVTDSTTIDLVKNGLREVSCGYEAEYVQIGVGRYVQKNIIGNHLALVEEARAGSAYAINDHKGKGNMSLKAKITAAFKKAETDLVKEIGGEEEAAPAAKTTDSGDLAKVLSAVEALNSKVEALSKPAKTKDMVTAPTQAAPAMADEEVAPSLEDRIAKLEGVVAALAEQLSKPAGDEKKDDKEKDKETSDEDGDEVTDEEGDDDEETSDEGCEDEKGEEETKDSVSTGDSVSRIEILAPGQKFTGKDAKRKALQVAYKTKDGKAVIEAFTEGKAPDFKNDVLVDTLFVGASELLKVKRANVLALAKTKTIDYAATFGAESGAKSATDINAIHAKHYENRK